MIKDNRLQRVHILSQLVVVLRYFHVCAERVRMLGDDVTRFMKNKMSNEYLHVYTGQCQVSVDSDNLIFALPKNNS